MTAAKRLAFVTIGHSPRPDIVPEMMAEIVGDDGAAPISVHEFGVLDGLNGTALENLRPKNGEPVFATTDSNGREIATSVARTEERLDALLHELDGQGYDLIVLLCTGTRITPPDNTLVIESQKVVDNAIAALTPPRGRIGILLPLERQIGPFCERHGIAEDARIAAASPYDGTDLVPQAAALGDCPVIAMHCMGYTRQMRNELDAAVPGHVLHARGLVAAFVRQFL